MNNIIKIKATNLQMGMNILNIGKVDYIEEYKNVIVVHLNNSFLKLDSPIVVFPINEYIYII